MNRFARTMCRVVLMSAAVALVGCEGMGHKNNDDMKMSSNKSLYERLGGEPAIKAVCEDFVGRAASDPKVNFFRKDVPGATEWKPTGEELATFKKHLVQFVEMAAGGPQKYEGRSMKSVHAGMKITTAQFGAIAKDLSDSLDHFKVPAKEKGELLSAVAATQGDIVEVK